jgi:hypothetical protein
MSSRRAYRIAINATARFDGAVATFESYSDLFSFVVGHVARRVMTPAEPLDIRSLTLFGVEMESSAKADLLQMAQDTLQNVAWKFNTACAGTKDADAWA